MGLLIVAWKDKIFEKILEYAHANETSFTVQLLGQDGNIVDDLSYIPFRTTVSPLERIKLLEKVMTGLEWAIMCRIVYPDTNDYQGDLYVVRGNFCETEKNNLADMIKCLSLESFFNTLAHPAELILLAAESRFA